MRYFIEVDALTFEIRYCGVFDISKSVCADLWPYTHCDVIRVLFVFSRAVVSSAQDSREINSCSYAHFSYHVTIAQWVKFLLYERCLARLMVLEKKRLGGSGRYCTVYTAGAVWDIATGLWVLWSSWAVSAGWGSIIFWETTKFHKFCIFSSHRLTNQLTD